MKIFRKKKGEGYEFTDIKGNVVKDSAILSYCKDLVIPPAYDDVTIYYEKNPKILFEGYDSKKRKQQIYSQEWVKKTTKKKFHLLIEFGQDLPRIHQDIVKYMKQSKMDLHKCVAVILKVISTCYFRVGHLKYEKLYGSHGISTLKKKHLHFSNSGLAVEFIGKKAQINRCSITDPVLIEILRDISKDKKPEEFIFSYRDPNTRSEILITALQINNFLKEYNPSFTSKMFRTFDTNTMFIDYVRDLGDPSKMTLAVRKKNVVSAMKVISDAVNNTPAICRKSYANQELLKMYIESPTAWKKNMMANKTSRQLFIDFLMK